MKKIVIAFLSLGLVVNSSACGMRPEMSVADLPVTETLSVDDVEQTQAPVEEFLSLLVEASPVPTALPVAPAEIVQSPAPTEVPQTPVPAGEPTTVPTLIPTVIPTAVPTTPPMPVVTPTPVPAHTHEWVEVKGTVHHEAVTEQVKIIDQPATEGHFEGGSYPVVVCRCGAEFTTAEAYIAHSEGEGFGHGGFTDSLRSNQVWVEGTPEISHYETVVVQEAWDEEIVTGYRCSCGAVK